MNNSIDVAIIGAGPYGLSLASFLDNAGIQFRIFGKTMDSWKTKMPQGMLLKSYPWTSCLYDPISMLTLKQFCTERGLPYHDYQMSIPLQTFVAYGEEFQARFVPNVENKMLLSIERLPEGFEAVFDDGEVLFARRIVIGVGVHPFKHIPFDLSHLPEEALSHSCEYGSLEGFAGKKVVVLGSGASATDLAALLVKKQANVTLVARDPELSFMPTPPEIQNHLFPALRRLASPLKPLKRMLSPISCIGSSWLLKLCANAPGIFHRLPERIRLEIVRNELGPLGHWAIKDILEGHVQLHLGCHLESAELRDNKLHLLVSDLNGTPENIQADHLIAATGYKIDLTKLNFLDKLISEIHCVENTPILSNNYESSVPGLYFIGPASANSFGPVARFVCGAIHPAKRITQHVLEKSKTISNSNSGLPLKAISDTTIIKDKEPLKSTQEAHIKHGGPKNILMISVMFKTPYRVLRCAHAAGANVFVLGSKGAKSLKSSRFCKSFFQTNRPIDGSIDAVLVEQINHVIETHHIDLILAGDTRSTHTLIAIRKLLNAPCFPMPDLNQFERLNNKWEFYLLCQALGIECPPSKLYNNVQEVSREIELNGLTSPKIAKPLDKEAGIGVIKLEPSSYRKQLKKVNYSPILVQDFIEGEDVGASVYCRNGKILAFISHTFRGYRYASFFDQSIYNELGKIVEYCKLDGIFNFDMRRRHDGRIFYLECNPRVYWKIAMSMLAGMNFISYGLSQNLGEGLVLPPSPPIPVRFPKAIMLLGMLSPWKLDSSCWKVLKFLYCDPIPYLRELFGLEIEPSSNG